MDKIEFWKKHNLKNYIEKGGMVSQSEIDHVVDWLKSRDGLRYHRQISKLSVNDAVRLSNEWTARLIKSAKDQESCNDIEVVYKFEDGFKVVKLLTQQAYLREGKLMGHCVGGYSVGDQDIYSLRDKSNHPHATIEIKNKFIDQIQGKENKPVVRKYHKYVQNFLTNNFPNEFSKLDNKFLPKIGLLKDESSKELYDVYNLPNRLLVFKNPVNLSNLGLDFFPNIVCHGIFNLSHNQIKEIPKNFEQNGPLYLSNNQIKEIPKDFNQTGTLDLSHNQIKEIPKNFEQNGPLYLSNNQIKEIPKDFNQTGTLDLSHNQIKEIPKDFKQYGFLNLSYNQIKEIPKNFEQNGELYLSNNQIKEIPKDFKQTDSLYLSHNQIKEIPKSFEQNGPLGLSHNQIKEIPKDFKQNEYLYLSHNQIKEIPKNFEQNGELYLSHNQIKEIPKNFKQNGYLDLSYNQIQEIPKDFKQNGSLNLDCNLIKETPNEPKLVYFNLISKLNKILNIFIKFPFHFNRN